LLLLWYYLAMFASLAETAPGDREDLRALPPAAKFVLATIATETDTGAITCAELGERTLLCERTIAMSLRRLWEPGLVTRRADPTDARRTRYLLHDETAAPLTD
jgi:DNA-binding MarR family transcriptional regulator